MARLKTGGSRWSLPQPTQASDVRWGNVDVNWSAQASAEPCPICEEWEQLWHALCLPKSPWWPGSGKWKLFCDHFSIPAEKVEIEKSCRTWCCRRVSHLWKPGSYLRDVVAVVREHLPRKETFFSGIAQIVFQPFSDFLYIKSSLTRAMEKAWLHLAFTTGGQVLVLFHKKCFV